MTRIYVGNLSRETTEESLRRALEQEGRTVTWIALKKNATTGKPRGFAFADMGTREEAEAAIAALHGTQLDGRQIKVNFAKELSTRTASSRDFSFGGRSGGFGGRGSRR